MFLRRWCHKAPEHPTGLERPVRITKALSRPELCTRVELRSLRRRSHREVIENCYMSRTKIAQNEVHPGVLLLAKSVEVRNIVKGTVIYMCVPYKYRDRTRQHCILFPTGAILKLLVSRMLTRRTRPPPTDDIHHNVDIAFSLTRAPEALSASKEPVCRDNDHDDRVDCTDIIHRACRDGLDVRERVHDEGEE